MALGLGLVVLRMMFVLELELALVLRGADVVVCLHVEVREVAVAAVVSNPPREGGVALVLAGRERTGRLHSAEQVGAGVGAAMGVLVGVYVLGLIVLSMKIDWRVGVGLVWRLAVVETSRLLGYRQRRAVRVLLA
jgi:hypothetical protein